MNKICLFINLLKYKKRKSFKNKLAVSFDLNIVISGNISHRYNDESRKSLKKKNFSLNGLKMLSSFSN